MSNILYKYLDINGAKSMIGNQNLQFTNASQLNDPFDCHPKLIDYSNVPESKLQGWVPKEWWMEKEENDALNLRNGLLICAMKHGFAVCRRFMIHCLCGAITVIITKVFALDLI